MLEALFGGKKKEKEEDQIKVLESTARIDSKIYHINQWGMRGFSINPYIGDLIPGQLFDVGLRINTEQEKLYIRRAVALVYAVGESELVASWRAMNPGDVKALKWYIRLGMPLRNDDLRPPMRITEEGELVPITPDDMGEPTATHQEEDEVPPELTETPPTT